MLILLHGENTFASLEALDKLIAGKPGVVVIDGSEAASLGDLFKDQDTYSLFGDAVAKTTVIKRVTKNSKKNLQTELVTELARKNPDNLNLIFWEDKALNTKDKLHNFIKKKGKLEIRGKLDNSGLTSWLITRAKESGIKLNLQLAKDIVFQVGTDQHLLANELQKLVLLLKSEERTEIEKKDLESLTVNEQDIRIFQLTDALATGNRIKIIGLANKIMQTDQDFNKILLPMIARQIKILFLAKQFSSAQLVKDFNVPDFVIPRVLQQARNFEIGQLKQIFNKLTNLDYAVKQGKIEPRLGLNLLLATI